MASAVGETPKGNSLTLSRSRISFSCMICKASGRDTVWSAISQTDLEEAKSQEIAKLKSSLEGAQSKVEQTNALLIKEREAAQKAIEEATSIVEEKPVLVEDTEKIDALNAEVENLKVPTLNS